MLLLCLAVLGLIGTSPCAAAPPWIPVSEWQPVSTAPNRNKLLLISFDGFRWDYDQDVETPNLDMMVQDGVKAAYVTPPFLTITSPSHFTMLTGRYVENHGVIHNIWFNTTTQEKKQYYSAQFIDSYWDNGSLPIWITAQRQGLKAGSLHFPGTAATYRGETASVRQVEPPFYNHSNETDWRLNIDKVIEDWFLQQDLDFVSLYFGEPDLAGHKYGPSSPERRAMVQQVDRTVGYIRDKIQNHSLTDRLNVIITADHGMSTILQGGQVEKIILSKIPGFSFKDIQFQLLDYGPVGMLLPKEGMLEKVYQVLNGSHPHLHVYKKEDMPARLHYSNHPRLLPLILIADPGYIVNGFLPLNSNKGEHGFDNEEMDMKAFFRAVGPDFHKNKTVDPFDLVDVYPLMCHLLGINPEVNDGNLDNTRHMLVPRNTDNSTTTVTSSNTNPRATVGDDLLFSCYLHTENGNPTFSNVSVTWKKTGLRGVVYQYVNGAPNLEDQHQKFVGRTEISPGALVAGDGSLLLRHVRKSDEGEYTCSISSSQGGGTISIQLTTADSTTTVTSSNTNPRATVGDYSLLSCYLHTENGNSTFSNVSVTWKKTGLRGVVYQYVNGAPNFEDQHQKFVGRTKISPGALVAGDGSLLLRDVRKSDEGEYTCSISSSQGGGTISIQLTTAAPGMEYRYSVLIILSALSGGLVLVFVIAICCKMCAGTRA